MELTHSQISIFPFLLMSLPLTTLALPQSSGFGLATPSIIESTQCQRNEDCTSKYNDTVCFLQGRFCQCEKGFIPEGKKCLPVILDLVSECEINAQCARGLGDLSRCNEESKRCECWDSRGNGKNETAYAPHTCYYRKALGDRCDLMEECRASISPPEAVRCDVPRRVCLCEEGKSCENLKGSGERVEIQALGILIMGLIAMKVVV